MREQEAVDAGWGGTRDPARANIGGRIRWYVNRLSCMSPAEVGHRVLRSVANQAERWRPAGPIPVEGPDLARKPRHWVHVAAPFDAALYMAAADRVAAGRFDLFALRDVELGSPPRWNRDPRSGIEAPLTFGKSLDYRDAGRVGDIKYLWELNRHLHLVRFAQAYALSGETRYFTALREHLESWIASCPFRRGPNWSSALEAAIRLINWSVAWQLLGGAHSPLFADADGSRFRQSWLESAYRHAQFIRGHFSSHSSANNHLVGEAAGLFVAALTWPHWPIAGEWRAEARAVLEREAVLQIAPDGVNREQAVSYQQFVLDFLLQALLAGRANGEEFPAWFEARIEAMIEYLASIMDAGGNVPMIGDSDDALVVSLDPGPACPYRSHLAAGALLFRRGDFKAKAGALDDKARWLFGEGADAAFQALTADHAGLPARRTFPDGGYYILGCGFESADEIRIVADAGPLGYLGIAAHGHADALAFTLSVGGEEFLVDPGTYAYHTHRTWREYFRGTSAHSTLRVDGKDQSQSGGNFMWVRKANARCDLWQSSDEQDVFEATHDGYTRLPDPVTHRRRITLDKRRRRVIIEDTLRMAGAHDVELYFHCDAQCRVESGPSGGYAILRGSRQLVLTPPDVPGAASRIYRGSHLPMCGWISRRFDEKEPAPTIAWKARLAGYTTLRSEILC